MRGKLCKQIRRLTANPMVPAETSYEALEVKTEIVEREGLPDLKIHKHMIFLGQCHRKYYQRLKDNVKRIRQGMQPRILTN